MADIVRYTTQAAVKSHRLFQRQGANCRNNRVAGAKGIIDGFLAVTVVTGQNSVTTVFDVPAQILWCSRESIDGFVTVYFGLVAKYGFRSDYTPSVDPLSPLADPSKLRRAVARSKQYVGWDYNVTADGTGRAYTHGLPTVDGEWLYGTPNVPVQYEGLEGVTERDLVMVLWGVRWNVSTPLSPTDNALVIPEDDSPNKTRVVEVSAVHLAALGGRPDIRTHQLPNNVFRFNTAVKTTHPEDDSEPVTSAYFVVGGADLGASVVEERAYAVLGRVDLIDDVPELDALWGAAVPLWVDYTGGFALNVQEGVGIYAGELLTGCAMVHNAYGGGGTFYDTRVFTLDLDTGAELSNESFATYPDVALPVCSSPHGLWVVKAKTDADVIDSTELYRIVDGVATLFDLGGWTALSALLPGIEETDGVWVLDAMAPAVVDLGGQRVGVIACPPGSYSVGTAATWYLLELDNVTGDVVGTPKLIGALSVLALVSTLPRPLSLSVVSPQVIVDGVVETPAVLLSALNNSTRLSTDGGETWGEIALGVRGYPYYFGNNLHAFKPGETI